MASRIIILEVPDTRTGEDVNIAIQVWNEQTKERPDRHITILHQVGFPTTDTKEQK